MLGHQVKILIAYICVANGVKTAYFAHRFIRSYHDYPARADHTLMVVCQGGPVSEAIGEMFPAGTKFYPRENDGGWDISAYCDVARKFPCDMLCCFGESIYFHRPGWLARLVDAWHAHGPGMYGLFSSNNVRPHLGTTGFVVDPNILKAWPTVRNKEDRYNFEHGPGPTCFWRRVESLGRPVRFVTWDGAWSPEMWRQPANILWAGDQSNLLAHCTHSDNYAAADPHTQRNWARNADRAFKV